MKQAIKKCKEDLKTAAAHCHSFLVQIQELEFGSLENARLYNTLRREWNKDEPRERVEERRAQRKALRQPKTGPQRSVLWVDKRDAKYEARYLHLAYGHLRGRPYVKLEPKVDNGNEVCLHMLCSIVEKYTGEYDETKVSEWLQGTSAEKAA